MLQRQNLIQSVPATDVDYQKTGSLRQENEEKTHGASAKLVEAIASVIAMKKNPLNRFGFCQQSSKFNLL